MTVIPSSPDLYYHSGYWNDYPEVAAEINRRISGDPAVDYLGYFRRAIGGRRFGRALFLNCGNGWVERAFLAAGVIANGVGIDISEELLERARADAAGLPLHYARLDINEGRFPDARYDLIVNYAAAHHIACPDRVFRAACRALTPDGVFVSYDYVGPHRNQYDYAAWEAVWRLNESLPHAVRQRLAYPHLPTMLATDPTEAIHSELTLAAFRRYFTVDDLRCTGGAVAYPLLTFNQSLASASNEDRVDAITRIIAADGHYLTKRPDSTLFAYWHGRPRHDVLEDRQLLDCWSAEEVEREESAGRNGGVYYAPTLLQRLMYDPDGTGAERSQNG